MKRDIKRRKFDKQTAAAMFDALVRLEGKLLALQTLDDFDREILATIGPALNTARGVLKSHSADLEA